MKIKAFISILLLGAMVLSCDDNTDEIGSSLISNMDDLEITTDTFEVTTRSILADSVYSRTTTGYLGKVRDPETGAYITGDFISQFYVLQNVFPPVDSITTYESIVDGVKQGIYADSCDIYLTYDTFYGDSLTAMKMTVKELSTPMSETVKYYSNYDPEADNIVRDNGISVDKMYSLTDLNVSDSLRSEGYSSIRIKLNQPYTDKDNKTYNNIGTYIMQRYYSPDSVCFQDPYRFIHEVLPGFYFKIRSGLGSMAYIANCRLNVYYKMNALKTVTTTDDDGNSVSSQQSVVSVGASTFYGTEEVLQTTKITNDKSTLNQLVNDNTCTYIKSPAGIFTEMTLPVDEILNGHNKDTLNTAKITISRINDKTHSEYALSIPQTLLMLPKSEMYSFFENAEIADYKTSFLSSYSSSNNTYTFNNISSLIKALDKNSRNDADWNKVVIIPVTATYTTISQTQILTKIEHDMSMTSTKLVGGSENTHSPIKISVIYSKFK